MRLEITDESVRDLPRLLLFVICKVRTQQISMMKVFGGKNLRSHISKVTMPCEDISYQKCQQYFH
jgi:hypothetical protein